MDVACWLSQVMPINAVPAVMTIKPSGRADEEDDREVNRREWRVEQQKHGRAGDEIKVPDGRLPTSGLPLLNTEPLITLASSADRRGGASRRP